MASTSISGHSVTARHLNHPEPATPDTTTPAASTPPGPGQRAAEHVAHASPFAHLAIVNRQAQTLAVKAAATPGPTAAQIRHQPLSFQVIANADAARFTAITERIKASEGMYYTSRTPPSDPALQARWAKLVSASYFFDPKAIRAAVRKAHPEFEKLSPKARNAALAPFVKREMDAQAVQQGAALAARIKAVLDSGEAQKFMFDELSSANAKFFGEVAKHMGPEYAGKWGVFVQRRPLVQVHTLAHPGKGLRQGLDPLLEHGAILVVETYPQFAIGKSHLSPDKTRLLSSADPPSQTYSQILKTQGQAAADRYLVAKLLPYLELAAYQRSKHPGSASPVSLVIDARGANNRHMLERLFIVATQKDAKGRYVHPKLAEAFRHTGPSVFKWDAAPASDKNDTPANRDEAYVDILTRLAL
jgi:hypothetical protein